MAESATHTGTLPPIREWALASGNPHLARLSSDYLYHLGLSTHMDLRAMFSDVKFVLMGGSALRMRAVANRVAREIGLPPLPFGAELAPIGKTERYELYKFGPVICVNHGMGCPSLAILLHEVTKLLLHAGATNFVYIRIGTSGGLGVPGGSVVVSRRGLSPALEPFHKVYTLGEEQRFPAECDETMAHELLQCAGAVQGAQVMQGDTISTDDFYEEQGRIDGFLCAYSDEAHLAFLRRAHAMGVRNMEMEVLQLASFCGRAKIPCACVCTTLLNRLEGDQVTATPAELAKYAENAIDLVLEYVRRKLAASRP